MRPYFRLACSEDLEVIAENLDDQSIYEIGLVAGDQSPLDNLLANLHRAICGMGLVYVVCNSRGTPVAVFGLMVESNTLGTGCLWFLTTRDWTPAVAKATLRQTPGVIRVMMQTLHVRTAYNWVPARFPTTVKWCRAVGFKVNPPADHEGEPCHFIEWRA